MLKSHIPYQGRLHSLDVLRGFDMFFIMGGDALLLYLCWQFPGTWMDAISPHVPFWAVWPNTPEGWQSVALAAGYVAVCWIFLYFLHRKRIYLKV